ncbi:MAG TPA: glycoside hydrolase, partial [Chryseosolibacter sp.]|nr:glycoside hydrolase [Chryseosolibacter sp.]
YNNTHRAVDMIPKDVVICDWHYERADKTAVYFAMKGLKVVTCPWRNPLLAVAQTDDMARFIADSPMPMKANFLGMVQTVWSDPQVFIDGFYAKPVSAAEVSNTPWDSFRSLFRRIEELRAQPAE